LVPWATSVQLWYWVRGRYRDLLVVLRQRGLDASEGERQPSYVEGIWRRATDLRRAIADRRLSPVEVVADCLASIRAGNDSLNAFLAVDEDRAMAGARRAEEWVRCGKVLGPLFGIPVGVKDVEDTVDLQTTFGSRLFADHRPVADSPLVSALRRSGAVVVGKTNTPAFALLGETHNELRADCCNPWDRRLTCGGSSGGSAAAVAAGMVPLATGSDYGGSIPAPASFCGVVGFKPSHQRVAVFCGGRGTGLFDAVGALGTSVGDMMLFVEALDAFSGWCPSAQWEDQVAAASVRAEHVSLAWSSDLARYPVEPEVVEIAARAVTVFEDLGCQVVEEAPPLPDPWDVFAPLCATDLRLTLGGLLDDPRADVTEETRAELRAVPKLTCDEYAAAIRRLHRFRAAAAAFFGRVPVVATPTTAVSAFPLRHPPTQIAGRLVQPGWPSFMPFQVPWNITGGPVISLPAGFTTAGTPVGLQLAAAPHSDALLLALATRYEDVRPWPGHP
jgi:Asp-tRNA(Asn)/Glu-tRNA(Gln) amidotransferase A subunit family amidase